MSILNDLDFYQVSIEKYRWMPHKRKLEKNPLYLFLKNYIYLHWPLHFFFTFILWPPKRIFSGSVRAQYLVAPPIITWTSSECDSRTFRQFGISLSPLHPWFNSCMLSRPCFGHYRLTPLVWFLQETLFRTLQVTRGVHELSWARLGQTEAYPDPSQL